MLRSVEIIQTKVLTRKDSRFGHSEISKLIDERSQDIIRLLNEISHQEGLVNDIKMESTSDGVVGQIRGNNKTILFKLLSRGNEIEAETIYSMFLKILETNSQATVILCPSFVDESIANLAELYDIKIIPLETRTEIERSLRTTMFQVFG